ncbi:MAG: TlpA family protein disulfide reductase [Gracilimonas sp.]|uniref:TlpA family protein disulfide reductase n=1 Tax=Gracilimonas sp. TaxID=1974203 RepID=UPI001B2E9DFE|nr:TlpA disulfide reductase family protein [Gracilimonas sp.]MBO6585453.1 TlpA family protein disulfide reductase [Gracilimonas sp.]MBO6616449.1 TlpA family protein disulfide reductase [Gracilimonas sp.]
MKLLLSILLIVSSAVFSGPKVHNFKLKNLDNRTTSYEDVKGEKLTVIDFWATWCKPCIKSIPKFVDMYDEFESQGVQFVGISVDGPRNLSKVKPFSKSLGIDYPVLLDTDNNVMARLRVQAVPTLLIVNSEDEVVYFHEGYTPGEEKMIEAEINKLLSE